jgi:hypothetical protein
MNGLDNQEDSPFTVRTDMVLTAYTLGRGSAAVGTEGQGQELASNNQAAGSAKAGASAH